MIVARDVRVDLGGTTILQDVSFSVLPGEIVGILGPNGAGKSTLLSVLSGALAPNGGEAMLEGRSLADWPAGVLARKRAVLPQHSQLTFPFRALQVVLLGRSPHAGLSSRAADLAVAQTALKETGADHLADRIYTTLSGGEQQRVQMARILAQIDWRSARDDAEGRYLLLDEPTSSLDLAHQHSTLALARRAADLGIGVLAILHDLNLAAMYADRLVVMRRGRVVAEGPPDKVLTEELVQQVFDLTVSIARHPTRGCPYVVAT